jgi:hypothetical protein
MRRPVAFNTTSTRPVVFTTVAKEAGTCVMDSITHTLYRAITAEHNAQRAKDKATEPHLQLSGLQPINKRKHVWDAYADCSATDIHISLGSSECLSELLALQLEFIAAGFTPPAGMVECGGDVFISPGRVDLYVPSDDPKPGEGTWTAILGPRSDRGAGKRTGWEEQTI